MIWYRMVWYGMGLCGTVGDSVRWYEMVYEDMRWNEMIWDGMGW